MPLTENKLTELSKRLSGRKNNLHMEVNQTMLLFTLPVFVYIDFECELQLVRK